ncbi:MULTISPECIES: lytic murein transglycosylase [unclassified Chelatococcus]|uniref:lytic murein transglycosylase n=1 Tax=unclassified Chelatococcus TaxID=2638111 RepID=UPI001BCEA654|nr:MULTISPECIES: lytic murein transglycosylase [unclassified Chelatococcus]MBS7696049.1 lytic murein transglycosylase [Chelatococcus sp. YT9]MBX3558032.1 lytic murein transglycosylase [Chelatococcus sp.]
MAFRAGRGRRLAGHLVAWPSLHVTAVVLVGLAQVSCSSDSYLTTSSISPAASAPTTTTRLSRPTVPTQEATAVPSASFGSFSNEVWESAKARGVSRRTFDRAFSGLTPDPKVIALTKKQSEFVKPVWEYLASAVSEQRLERGGRAVTDSAATLAKVEATYGVDRRVVAGVWGMETNFGSYMGSNDVIRSLATLAHANYRGDFFRGELVTALVILEQGHIDRDGMVGSWAGAMGQTQFMPSSFMSYAVDFTGDGRRDIWTSTPDALASTANYLKKHGWETGLPWGFEVKVPKGLTYGAGNQSFAAWSQAGVRRVDGRAMPAQGEARILMPAGARGPAFLVTKNFNVIKRYNNSDSYALGVAHLGDRLYGGAPIQAPWPTDDLPLDRMQSVELQKHLAAHGYDVGEPDGKLGSQTRAAIASYQERMGLPADGYPSVTLLERLRRSGNGRAT